MSSLVDEFRSNNLEGYFIVYQGKFIEEFLLQIGAYEFLRFSAEECSLGDDWEVITRLQIQKEKISDFKYKFKNFTESGFEKPALSKIVAHDKTRAGKEFSCECGIKLTNETSGSTLTLVTGGGRHEALTIKANFIEHQFYPECENGAYAEVVLLSKVFP